MKTWEELTEEDRKPYFDKAVEVLQDHLTCTRVWSAWSYGTMTQDDFGLAAEDDNIVSDTAKMLFDFVMGAIIQQQLQPDSRIRTHVMRIGGDDRLVIK